MIPMRTKRATFDLLTDGVAWVRSVDAPSGSRVTDFGVVPALDFREGRHAALGRDGLLRGQGRADVVLRGPEVHIQRIDLPDVTRAEAQRVAQRRKRELEASDPTEATCIATLVDSAGSKHTVWLISAHRDVCEAADFDLGLRGLRVDRLVPLPLALGGVNRLLRPARSRGLTAILWLDVATGTCVVADRLGWVFDREIPLKYAGDRMLRTDDAESAQQDEDDHHVDRLATELKRTFAYVQQELRLGEVVRVRVCGLVDDVDGLAQALGASLKLEVRPVGAALSGKTEVSISPHVGAALGAAMLPRPAAAANLLPVEVQGQRCAARVRRSLVAALVLTAAISVSLATLGVLRVRSEQGELALVREYASGWESKRESLRKEVGLRSRADQVRAAARALARPEPPWGPMLVAFASVLPPSLFVERLDVRFASGGWTMSVSLEGDARRPAEAANAAAELREQLENHYLFRLISIESDSAPSSGAEWGPPRYRLTVWVVPVLSEGDYGG